MIRRDRRRGTVFTRRALLIGGAQTLMLAGLAARLRQVQVEEGRRYATMAQDNSVTARLIAPQRGRILDRFGAQLAGNLINWRALLIAEQTTDVRQSLDNFSAIVPLTDAERARIDRDLHHGKGFVPVLIKEFLSRDTMTMIEVNAPDLPGILVDAGASRSYNFPYELAHVLGYVAPPNDSDMNGDPLLSLPGLKVGRAGVEKFHDMSLRGHPGVAHLEVNAVGRVIRELDRTDGVNGEAIGLSFDVDLQLAVQKLLGDEAASAVVLDCRNGEIMAMVSNPSFDPTLFATGISQAQWADWTKDRRTPLINKATSGLYAPGSTFKMAVALAGLEARTIGMHDRLNCPGHLDLGSSRFHCWNKRGHGALDLHQALKYSCDVYLYQVALRTGIDRISAMSRRLGLGTELDIDIPGQRVGLVPTREWRLSKGHPWELGDTVVSGIGQGYIVVSPLQLATYAARVATGRAVQPHFTRRIAGVMQAGSQPDDWPSLAVAEPMLDAVRSGMFAVVNEPGGTAPRARLDGPFQLAGKTGSSQVRRVSRKQRESGTFDTKNLPWEFRPHALFVAYAPYEQPRYAVSVVVEHGNAGGTAAAPIARDIMTEALRRDPASRPDGGPTPGREREVRIGAGMIEQRLWLKNPHDLTDKIFRINWLFVLLLCVLASVGYVALYSAAAGSPEPYATRHIVRFAFGLLLMVSIALVDIRIIARFSWVAYVGCVALLLLVLKIGHVGKGAQRWLELGGQQIQPSELMKLGLILALAAWFHRANWERMGNPLFLLPPLIMVLIPVGLILKEPNLGTAMITLMLGGVIFFAAGVRWWKFVLVLLPVPLAARYVYQHLHGYQRARIDTFLSPESDPLGAGYNIIQSKIALGSGGLWGKGFLQGTQSHLDFLPEKQTDFIFTMIGEEFGLVGAIAVITLLLLITWGALLIGLRCKHQFGRLVAFGIACNFFLYCFVNIAMVMGVIPVGGVPLPLISHGGSAMITMMVAFGILMSVQVHRDVEFDDYDSD